MTSVGAPKAAAAIPSERLVVYQHSDLLYWWIVWVYGYFCALLTWAQGKSVVLVDGGRLDETDATAAPAMMRVLPQ